LILIPVELGSGVLTIVVYEGGFKETSIKVRITGGTTNTAIIEGTSGVGGELREVGIIITSLIDEVTTLIHTPSNIISLFEVNIIIEISIIQESEVDGRN